VNNPENLRFGNFVRLVEAFGFDLERINGSHHIYFHRDLPVSLNLQPLNGQAKAYQVEQFLLLVESLGLSMDGAK
jgi:hypothetical protein